MIKNYLLLSLLITLPTIIPAANVKINAKNAIMVL
jgi:hypothetical protein